MEYSFLELVLEKVLFSHEFFLFLVCLIFSMKMIFKGGEYPEISSNLTDKKSLLNQRIIRNY